MPLLFAATLFVSASLLFMVQPMVGKMVLPLLGGSPAVWNACMVFFQALLLLGYLYAHFVASKYEPKKQWQIHLVVLALPIGAFLLAVMLGMRHSPIAIAERLAPTGESSPILSVLALLTVAIAVPFFVVSTSAPLLQMWFANTGHPAARDPYFLYSASNIGSMVSLLGYPLFIEPNLSIVGQAWLFAIGFGLLAAMVFFCGQAAANPIGVPPPTVQRGKQHRKGQAQQPAGVNAPAPVLPPSTEPPPAWSRKLKWIALAFVPSSLMLGVTFHMSTDIASIPLMWVIPLTLYLVTFIIAFGRVPDWFRIVIGNLAPVMILLLIFVLVAPINTTVGIELFLHIATFFTVALMCHYELARDRPSPQYLTEFFLLMSVGGMLGGVFNSLIAPLIFTQAYEYKLVLLVSCLMVPRLTDADEAEDTANSARAATGTASAVTNVVFETGLGRFFKIKRWRLGGNSPLAFALDILIPIVLGFAFYFLMRMGDTERFGKVVNSLHENLRLSKDTIVAILIFAVPVMVCFFFVDRPLRFALCAAAILAPITIRQANSGVIHTERSFFGILKVEQNGRYNRLVHGTTLHGTQFNEHFRRHWLDDFQMLVPNSPWDVFTVASAATLYDPRQEPLTYYHRSGPVGAAFRELRTRKNGEDAKAPFAMVGLGTGSVSCYAMPGQKLTFYEIDPAVKHLVADTAEYFTFVRDARDRGADVEIRMGDARLKLKEDTERRYALLLVDAFSSDAIPVHLLTRQAVELYLHRMTDDGLLALHISNKYVDLEPVVAQIVADIRSRGEFPDLAARLWSDSHNDERGPPGKTSSSWIVLARNEATLGTLALPLEEQRERFKTAFLPLTPLKGMPTWTDDFSDVMRVMMIPEVQKIRRLFGLPTLKDESNE